jgi:hypothetical protein
MKRLILMAFAALTLFSCSKSNNGSTPEPEMAQPTVLLKRITETTGGTSSVSMELTYNGKQLAKASYGKNTNGTFAIDHNFTYNTSGQLNGMSVTSTIPQPTYKKADITVVGSDVTNVSFTRYDNTLTNVFFTYNGGKLATQQISTGSASNGSTYTYDANGRNTRQQYINGNINSTYEYTSFDDKKNVLSALPYWSYFKAYSYNMNGLDNGYGANNSLLGKLTSTGGTYPTNETYTYSYTYNSFGYPATMTMKDNTGYTTSYAYDYIEVK